MQCDVCQRSPSNRLPFNCTLCARSALYQPRIQLAQTLLQTEALGKEVEQNVTGVSQTNKATKNATTKAPGSNPTWTVQRAAAEQRASEEKSRHIYDHVQTLREEIQKTKADIAARRKALQRRRSDLASAKQELSRCRPHPVEDVEKGMRRTEQRWDTLHHKTAESRVFLCREAAVLYGLQQRKRKKGGLGRDVYIIGGVPIADLRDLNSKCIYTSLILQHTLTNPLDLSPTQLSTANTNVAHLVHLVSHYLSLRLPAEITLPHRDFPLPTILSPSLSYTGREFPYPGSTPSHSSNNSPSASRHADQRPLPRPRPLHLNKKLSVLAKDDQVAYASFVEGITFLAWDIAWLCKTQGIDVGGSSWEEVCAMGKNLWQLLVAPPSRPPLPREVSTRTNASKPPISRTATAVARIPLTERSKETPPMGHFSHGTAYGYLATASGTEYMRDWRLQAPLKVIEKVKAMLLSERTGAEWELLEGNEWEEAEAETNKIAKAVAKPAIEETGILVKGEDGVERGADWSGREGASGRGDEERKGTSGWMKVKSRRAEDEL